jgi:polyhydroxyalkanoate synthesis regulator phasin
MADKKLKERVAALEKQAQGMSGYPETTPVVKREKVEELEERIAELERRLDDIKP